MPAHAICKGKGYSVTINPKTRRNFTNRKSCHKYVSSVNKGLIKHSPLVKLNKISKRRRGGFFSPRRWAREGYAYVGNKYNTLKTHLPSWHHIKHRTQSLFSRKHREQRAREHRQNVAKSILSDDIFNDTNTNDTSPPRRF